MALSSVREIDVQFDSANVVNDVSMHAQRRTVTQVTRFYLFVVISEKMFQQNFGSNFLSFACAVRRIRCLLQSSLQTSARMCGN
jgi:hypothetical protein